MKFDLTIKNYKFDPRFILDSFHISNPFSTFYHCVRFTSTFGNVPIGSLIFERREGPIIRITLITAVLPFCEEVQYDFPDVGFFKEYSLVFYQFLRWAGFKMLQNTYGEGENREIDESVEKYRGLWMTNMELIKEIVNYGAIMSDEKLDLGLDEGFDADGNDSYSDYTDISDE